MTKIRKNPKNNPKTIRTKKKSKIHEKEKKSQKLTKSQNKNFKIPFLDSNLRKPKCRVINPFGIFTGIYILFKTTNLRVILNFIFRLTKILTVLKNSSEFVLLNSVRVTIFFLN